MNEALKNLAIKMDEISNKKKLSMVFIDSIEEFFTVTLHDLIQIEMNGHLSTWDMKIGNDKGIIGLMRIINDYEYKNQ